MPIYKVRDNETGKTIEFNWNSDTKPTESDMEEVFAQAKTMKQPAQKEGILSKIGNTYNKAEDAIKQFRTGVGEAGAGAIQSALPVQPQIPAKTPMEAATRTLGQMGATVAGSPEAVSRTAQYGVKAGAETLIPTPTETAVGLATGGALGLAGKAVKKLAPVFSKEAKLAMFDKTKRVLYEQNNKAVESFGNSLKQLSETNPDKVVNLSEIVSDIKDMDLAGMLDPKVKTSINSIPEFRKIVSGSIDASQLSAKESQNIINMLENKLPEGALTGKTTLKPSQFELKNLINDIKSAQADAFPEMLSVRKDYGQFKNAYKSIKKKLITDNFYNNLEKSVENPIVKREIDKALPKEFVNELGGYVSTAKTIRLLKNIGIDVLKWGAIAGGGGYLAGKIAEDVSR